MKKFYCYSARLHRFFEANNILPIYMFVSRGKGYPIACYVYEGTEELNRLKNEVYPTVRDKF